MILLDTHVVLWWSTGDARLSSRASRHIAMADQVLVSPVSCWEIAMLVMRRTIRLDREIYEWTRDLFAQERVQVASLSPQGAVGAALLNGTFPGDPADRFLYCTARELPAPLVTKDRALRDYSRSAGDVKTIW